MDLRAKRLAIITTHPIQYNAPLFKLISSSNIACKVFYTWGEGVLKNKFDPDFGRVIDWDIPLLDGYTYEFLRNVATEPGSHHANGIVNPEAIDKIEEWSPNALLIYGWNFHSHQRIMRHFNGKIKLIFRGDSTLIDYEPWLKSIVKKLVLKWVFRNIDVALYTGKHNFEYFKRFGLKENQLVYVPHAVDNERFRSSTIDIQVLKCFKLGLDIEENTFTILFAGKLENKKNPSFVIELAKQLPGDAYKFLIVGNGHLEEELKKCAQQDSRIIFLPFQNQSFMPYVYHASKIFILPSNGPGETWGLAVNEAMAAGLPVVLSEKVGAAPDLVKDKFNGMIFKKGEGAKVASFIKDLATDNNKYQMYSDNSLSIVAEFTFSKFISALEQIMYE